MKIGFFFMHPPDESMGSLYRVKNLCNGLTRMSHECYIFSPFDYDEDWGSLVQFITVPSLTSGGKLSNFIYREVRKILNSHIFSKFTLLNPRIFNLTVDKISQGLLSKIKEENIDLNVIIGETEIGGFILTQIKDKLNIPIVVDYQNFWPEELVEHKVIKRNSKSYNFLINIEKEVIENVDLIITISQALNDFLIDQFDEKYRIKIKTINNGGNPVLDKPKQKSYPPKIINSGMVVQRSNFDLFLRSVPYVLNEYPDAQILITRKGEKLNETMKQAKKMKTNVNFYWKDTFEEYLNLLSECHIGIVTSTYELSRKLGFVAKVYDYFSVGIPVVGNDIGGWTSIIPEEKVGLLSSNEPKDLADKILYFLNNPDMSYEYGKRGIELLRGKYSENESARKLIKNIESIIFS